jgi:surface antigen
VVPNRPSCKENGVNKSILAALGLTLLASTSAMAQPPQMTGDEGYNRLARWEKHLDDSIADQVRRRRLDGTRAWRIQKNLDDVELDVVQAYYQDHRIDFGDFRRFAVRLRDISRQLGEDQWGQRNVYGDGWSDSDRGGYGPPPPPTPGYGPPPPPPQAYNNPPPPPPGNYYREGEYEQHCRSGNVAAGTIFGAIAGGLIGGAASHGNGGAIAGGVILGGLAGNALSRDVDCDDQRFAFNSYDDSLNGDVGREYRWQHNANYGTFTSTREYRDGPYVCRDFHTVSYRGGQRFDRDGTACREADGNWRFR